MKTQSADTSGEAERAQIALLRQATMARRAALADDLSRTVIALSRAGMKRARPGADDRELERAFLALNYGEDLAERTSHVSVGRQMMGEAPSIWVAMTPVIAALEDLGVAYYVGGSVASSAYGMPRATAHVDLVADLKAEHVERLVAALQDVYYVAEEAVREAIERHASFSTRSTSTR